MNTTDYCPRGRELYAEYRIWWNNREWHPTKKVEQQTIRSWQKYRQHVDECELCEKEE